MTATDKVGRLQRGDILRGDLPSAEQYSGRFFQYLEGGAGGHENVLPVTREMWGGEAWQFNLAFDELGGYLVESNQGHFSGEGVGFKDDIEMFRGSAQSSRFSREVAAEMYGAAPHHGYIWGQSGGGIRTLACLENVDDV